MSQHSDPRHIANWLRERVTGELQCDSRRVRPGDAFVAWPGFATDGRRFVPAALQAGATAVLVEAEGVEALGFSDERVRAVPGLKALEEDHIRMTRRPLHPREVLSHLEHKREISGGRIGYLVGKM